MKTFKMYCDPGHGWIAVKRKLLVDLHIADRISSYSYQRGDTVYLEEDCDASVLIQALTQRGIEHRIDVYNASKSSRIRNYEGYMQ